MNTFTSFFTKSPSAPKRQPVKQSFSLRDKSVYFLTKNQARFEGMMEFFKQFDLKNIQNWETSREEFESFVESKVLWKFEKANEGEPSVREMDTVTLDFYKSIFLSYKPDFYIFDYNLGLERLTGQHISQCLYFALNTVAEEKTPYPPVVYLCTPGNDSGITLHKRLRYVMLSPESTVSSIAPTLYAQSYDLLQSIEHPSFIQKIFASM